MPVTDTDLRKELRHLLGECGTCNAAFLDNATLIASDAGVLFDWQIAGILKVLRDAHKEH